MVDDSALLSSDQKQYRNALEGHARKHIIQNEWLKESLNQVSLDMKSISMPNLFFKYLFISLH